MTGDNGDKLLVAGRNGCKQRKWREQKVPLARSSSGYALAQHSASGRIIKLTSFHKNDHLPIVTNIKNAIHSV